MIGNELLKSAKEILSMGETKENHMDDGAQTINVQIVGIEWPAFKTGKRAGQTYPLYGLSENSVTDKASSFDTIPGANIGAWGNATLVSKTVGGKLYYNLEKFDVTMPAGEKPATAPLGSKFSDEQKIDQAKWDGKDRAIIMQNGSTGGATIAAAAIRAGIITGTEQEVLDKALSWQDTIAAKSYERALMAKQDRIATKANPYASDN